MYINYDFHYFWPVELNPISLLKLSKEVENANMVSMVDQSMLKPFGEKSIYKQRNKKIY